MSGKWTPGPWWTSGEYEDDDLGCAVIAARTDCGPLPGNPARGMVAWATGYGASNSEQSEANARLIAAAPRLFDALKDLVDETADMLSWGCEPDVIRNARAALAKAKGEGA